MLSGVELEEFEVLIEGKTLLRAAGILMAVLTIGISFAEVTESGIGASLLVLSGDFLIVDVVFSLTIVRR